MDYSPKFSTGTIKHDKLYTLVTIGKNCGYCHDNGNGGNVADTAPCSVTTRFTGIAMWSVNLKKSILSLYFKFSIAYISIKAIIGVLEPKPLKKKIIMANMLK